MKACVGPVVPGYTSVWSPYATWYYSPTQVAYTFTHGFHIVPTLVLENSVQEQHWSTWLSRETLFYVIFLFEMTYEF